MKNEFEKAYVPETYKPLTPWQFFGLEILYALPGIGLIFLICHAIGSKNICRRNFARSYFCVLVVILILGAIGYFLYGFVRVPEVVEQIKSIKF